MFPEDFIDSKEVLGNVVRYFASFGEAIRDFTVEEFCQEDERDAVQEESLPAENTLPTETKESATLQVCL